MECLFIGKELLMLGDCDYHACQSTLIIFSLCTCYLRSIKFISTKYLWWFLIRLALDQDPYICPIICEFGLRLPNHSKALADLQKLGIFHLNIRLLQLRDIHSEPFRELSQGGRLWRGRRGVCHEGGFDVE